MLAKYGWCSDILSVRILHFTVFEDNLQNILSIIIPFVSVTAFEKLQLALKNRQQTSFHNI